MGTDRRTGRGRGNRAALFAALLTLIGVTLLSALAPLGPPLSRARGSAFNPATSEVVVKARKPLGVEAREAARPDGRKPLIALFLGVAALFLLTGSRAVARPASGLRADPRPHPALTGTRSARAPPASA